MKKIEAYIKENKKHSVIEALHIIEGLTGVSFSSVEGYGRERNDEGPVRIVDTTITTEMHLRLDVVCNDSIADAVIEAIEKGAHTGLRSDGKIYVYTVTDAIRISTGERGEGAV